MSAHTPSPPEVFSAREVALAAGVSPATVEGLVRSGAIDTVGGRFVAEGPAVAAVRRLRSEAEQGRQTAFQLLGPRRHGPGRAFAASGVAHAAALTILAIATAGTVQEARKVTPRSEPARMVFVAVPGPGGGGGGGGLRQTAPPPAARLAGPRTVRSAVPPPRRVAPARPVERRAVPPPPVRPRPVERPVEPPAAPPAIVPLPEVVAPVASAASDAADRAGILAESPAESASNGTGSGGGAGSGAGTGIGEGQGSGIGPGSGGGTGGGPYRPGSGITPPAIVREVKPQYTQEARRRAVEGDVVVELIVRADGSVGQVRLLQGLGAGLDERAIEAVRQWRFSPARRHGTPVDVVVEVAVEFKLR